MLDRDCRLSRVISPIVMQLISVWCMCTQTLGPERVKVAAWKPAAWLEIWLCSPQRGERSGGVGCGKNLERFTDQCRLSPDFQQRSGFCD